MKGKTPSSGSCCRESASRGLVPRRRVRRSCLPPPPHDNPTHAACNAASPLCPSLLSTANSPCPPHLKHAPHARLLNGLALRGRFHALIVLPAALPHRGYRPLAETCSRTMQMATAGLATSYCAGANCPHLRKHEALPARGGYHANLYMLSAFGAPRELDRDAPAGKAQPRSEPRPCHIPRVISRARSAACPCSPCHQPLS